LQASVNSHSDKDPDNAFLDIDNIMLALIAFKTELVDLGTDANKYCGSSSSVTVQSLTRLRGGLLHESGR